MVLEEYYTAGDYVSCDYLDCGEAECFDLPGEVTCMCVDTLAPPDGNGLCSSDGLDIQAVDVGSGAVESRVDGIVHITPGMTLWNQVNQVNQVNQDLTELTGLTELTELTEVTEPPEPEHSLPPDSDVFPTAYMISGLCALVLLAIGLFAIIYVLYSKLRRSRSLDLESQASLSSKGIFASQSPLLVHSVQEKRICPLGDSEKKPSLDLIPSTPNSLQHSVGNFGTFEPARTP